MASSQIQARKSQHGKIYVVVHHYLTMFISCVIHIFAGVAIALLTFIILCLSIIQMEGKYHSSELADDALWEKGWPASGEKRNNNQSDGVA